MSIDTIDTYYRTLGVTENATLTDIKKAFRSKAKELHPDRNKSPDAHEQFILLTEAYEYLINLRNEKAKTESTIFSYDEWEQQYRDDARERARHYARMQYEEFKKTDYYKKSQAINTIFAHFYFFSSILLILSPLWGFLIGNWNGFLAGLLVTFVTVNYWANLFKEKININLKSLFRSIEIVVKTKTFMFFIVTLVNLYALFRYTLNTQLTILSITASLLGLYIVAFIAAYYKIPILRSLSKTVIFLCLVPTLFNLFFFTNFIFSSNPTIEKYSFVHEKRWYVGRLSRARLEKIAYIDLENDQYLKYHWFRMFFNFETMKDKKEIAYKFENGLWGLRVLKDYEFTR